MNEEKYFNNFSNNSSENNTIHNNINRFNLHNNHPLIPSSQEYLLYRKYVSIHSEDRDILKFPNSAEFEIELPQDLVNVLSLRLVNWTFPANYNSFSLLNSNISMTFKINKPYNPNENGVFDLLPQKIFECLFKSQTENYIIFIEEGFYNPEQMVTELTNKFNQAVYNRISLYFINIINDPTTSPSDKSDYEAALKLLKTEGYNKFVIVYNNVSQKIWFGNTSDGFILTNETSVIKNELAENVFCSIKSQLSDFSNWGLPGNLGLSRCNTESISGTSVNQPQNFALYNDSVVPRFYYGDVFSGDGGYWLLPNPLLTNSEVHWVECIYKINLMGPAYMYMELAGHNCIDETSPYNVSNFTLKTNQTNGIVNSSFAKISIPTTPISQWFDNESLPYKHYYPPAERIRKLSVKIRYHNGLTALFDVFNYSFVIEFTLQQPKILRDSRQDITPNIIR
jgi:hypothetical protein